MQENTVFFVKYDFHKPCGRLQKEELWGLARTFLIIYRAKLWFSLQGPPNLPFLLKPQ